MIRVLINDPKNTLLKYKCSMDQCILVLCLHLAKAVAHPRNLNTFETGKASNAHRDHDLLFDTPEPLDIHYARLRFHNLPDIRHIHLDSHNLPGVRHVRLG